MCRFCVSLSIDREKERKKERKKEKKERKKEKERRKERKTERKKERKEERKRKRKKGATTISLWPRLITHHTQCFAYFGTLLHFL